MKKSANIHPGRNIIVRIFKTICNYPYRLSKDIEIIPTRISQIIKGKRRIISDIAFRFSSYFGNSAKFWVGYKMITT